MGIPDRVSSAPGLPEQHLLRDPDRLQDFAGAFLRGEITVEQYSQMTLAEINRRASIDPLMPLGQPVRRPDPERLHEVPLSAPVTGAAPRAVGSGDDRASALAQAFVGGRLHATEFLRLIRDC